MDEFLPIPPELDALIGRRVKSAAGLTGCVRDVAFYRRPAGSAHGAQWHVTVQDEYGHLRLYDLATFNATWRVLRS